MTRARAELVEAARESIARGSQSFAAASTLFDRPTRERAWLLYAWCRKCDDIADGQEHGGALSNDGDAAGRLARIRSLTAKARAGEHCGDFAFDAFGLVARECDIPRAYSNDLIEGFALDAADWRPTTTADLMRYCYHVAGVVGKMMALVMGVRADDEATLSRACDLGYAFQLANVARDVREDAVAGRCYLPREWLAEVGLSDEALVRAACAPVGTPQLGSAPLEHMQDGDLAWTAVARQLAPLGKRLADMAATYEVSARIGARKLPFRARWAVLAAAGIYGDIAREVARRGEHAWDSRVVTSKAAKLGWVARALGGALR